MRVKVDGQWHEVTPTSAICVELSEADRRNIANMAKGATKYAAFSDQDPRDAAAKLEWME